MTSRLFRGPIATMLFACALFSSDFHLHAQTQLPIMPLPAHAVEGTGSLSISNGLDVVFEGHTEPRLERARDRFLANLARETGILPVPAAPGVQPRFVIKTAGPSAPVQQLGEDESYHLEVASTGVLLSAPNPLGILHGLQTFLQLVQVTPQGFAVAAVTIDDQPRFPWRGLMLDVGRHFMPLDTVRQTLDGMEAAKLNVLHWHLSENQGFRIESKVFPLLQEKGSDGLYYTQDQVRSIIEYARDRGIRVIPEFDMPGHATAWFVGYPDLASGKGPYRIERKWGVFDPAMDPTRESTYEFLDRFIGEMTALFPDAYFHIGGDECNGKEWDANPRIQAYMREHGIKNNAALQAYFTERAQKLVAKHGKITMGWDEVLQPETPKDVVIQSWRGQESLAQAARRGDDVVGVRYSGERWRPHLAAHRGHRRAAVVAAGHEGRRLDVPAVGDRLAQARILRPDLSGYQQEDGEEAGWQCGCILAAGAGQRRRTAEGICAGRAGKVLQLYSAESHGRCSAAGERSRSRFSQ